MPLLGCLLDCVFIGQALICTCVDIAAKDVGIRKPGGECGVAEALRG